MANMGQRLFNMDIMIPSLGEQDSLIRFRAVMGLVISRRMLGSQKWRRSYSSNPLAIAPDSRIADMTRKCIIYSYHIVSYGQVMDTCRQYLVMIGKRFGIVMGGRISSVPLNPLCSLM